MRWGKSMSGTSTVSNGVKQGGVLSPILFIIYVDELLSRLQMTKVGCHVGHTFCGALGYADDVTLLAPSVSAMNCLLKTCQTFAEEYHVKFNAIKSKYLFFGNNSLKPVTSPFFLNGSNIEFVEYDKHLGNCFGMHSKEALIDQAINVFNCKVNMVCTHFAHLNYVCKYKLFKTYCMPLYGSQLWDIDCKYGYRFYVAWRKAKLSVNFLM